MLWGGGAGKYQATTLEGDEPTGTRAGLQGQGVGGVKDASIREGEPGLGPDRMQGQGPMEATGCQRGVLSGAPGEHVLCDHMPQDTPPHPRYCPLLTLPLTFWLPERKIRIGRNSSAGPPNKEKIGKK